MKSTSSEFQSYTYIIESLRLLGWNTKNPNRNDDGMMYTQNEVLAVPKLKKLLGLDRPEFILVADAHNYVAIEAKSSHDKLDKAEKEAKQYGDKLNADGVICPIAIAVAGNEDDKYFIKSFFFANGEWLEVEINGRKTTGLLSHHDVQRLIRSQSNKIKDFEISDDLYYQKATEINEKLHMGAINKNVRARVVASILLALSTDQDINLNNEAYAMINEINAKVKEVLFKHEKSEFADSISIPKPPTPENHVKFRKALVDTIQELRMMNIKSAMNSGTDVLGRFYEQFLKYGNGAKEIGIVLTPRHITRLASEMLNINRSDKVYDPACGTGGFLVAAYDQVKKSGASQGDIDRFKREGIYGVEQEADVVALTLVNMIFRGDGKSNIIEGNCFNSHKFDGVQFSKVLMNPPFALKKDDEKEYKFIDHALNHMQDDGLLFVIIPSPVMFRDNHFRAWRQKMLRENTLEAVIKLPEDLFYPVGVHTSAVIIRKGVQHDMQHKVLWGWLRDGFRKNKGVMKEYKNALNNMELMKSLVIKRLNNIVDDTDSPREYIFAPIADNDRLELSPEQYLRELPIEDDMVLKEMQNVYGNYISSKIGVLA
ncbi:MAG TPA: N-6 DNA methylase [Candidatus Saccharimonadales bacterium]|nr:N-6 DNA methylase [Candidatus Saccharimonadales bacterium]